MLQYPGFNPIAFEIGPAEGPLVRDHVPDRLRRRPGASARRRAARPGSTWKPNDVDDLIFFGMLGVILGGRIGYVLFYGLEFLGARIPGIRFKIWEGGMSFHGGLLGVLAALSLFARVRRRKIADVFDFTAPLPGLGIFFGRIGNFINGELWGKPTTVPWGFNVDGQVLHASQLYEACLEGLVLFSVVWWFTSQAAAAARALGAVPADLRRGSRFIVEFVRVPDVQIGYLAGGWLTMGQLLSLPMILGGRRAAVVGVPRARSRRATFAIAQ